MEFHDQLQLTRTHDASGAHRAFFVVHLHNDLKRQLKDAEASIIEPLAVSSKCCMKLQDKDAIGQLISVLHRSQADIVRAIYVL